MAEISIGSAVGAGFQLITRKPLAVLGWGLVRVLFVAAVFALYAPMIMGFFSDVAQAKASGGDGASQAAVSTMMSHMMVMQGAGSLVNLLSLAMSAIIACAVARAVLHPERGAFAYLRLGAPEFFVAVVTFAAGIVVVLGILVFMIPFAILIGVLAAQKATAAVVIVCVLGVLALIAGLIYVLLRFAFVVPMMVDDGQFHLFDAWTLTKGRLGSLFLIGLALVAIALAAEAVIGAFVIALGVAALGAAAGGLQNVQSLVTLGPAVIAVRLAPWLIVGAVLAIPLEGCALAIFIAPWARAYRDVAPGSPAAIAPSPPPVQPAPAAPSPSPA